MQPNDEKQVMCDACNIENCFFKFAYIYRKFLFVKVLFIHFIPGNDEVEYCFGGFLAMFSC